MVLGEQSPGRVGRRRISFRKGAVRAAPFHGPGRSRLEREALQIRRVEGQEIESVLGHRDRVGVAEAPNPFRVEARLDREDHSRDDLGVVADVEERPLVVAQPDRVADVCFQ